jgi:hypothetical protein
MPLFSKSSINPILIGGRYVLVEFVSLYFAVHASINFGCTFLRNDRLELLAQTQSVSFPLLSFRTGVIMLHSVINCNPVNLSTDGHIAQSNNLEILKLI